MRLKSLVGDRAFYRRVFTIAVPIIIQNCITNFVNLLDNVMVGSLGTEAMSGVSIVNQFVFIFNLAIFGAISGAGIFTAQYNGIGDTDGVRNTFRVKLMITGAIGVLGVIAFLTLGDTFIGMFLHEGDGGDLAKTLEYGRSYLLYTVIGLIPYAISTSYASTLRETGETFMPMVASLTSVFTNFILNVILIFGFLGFPALGVVGAAIATSISRFAELGVLLVWTHTHTERNPFAEGLYKTFKLPASLVKSVAYKGMPMLINELLWSLMVTMRNQCFSTRGLDAVAGLNIAVTVINVLNVCYMSIGNTIGIIVGNTLGSGDIERAKDENKKLLALTVATSIGIALIEAAIAPFFPLLYNTTDSVRSLATFFMLVSAALTPFSAMAFASYFTLRSGGNVLITFLFDSVYSWCVVMSVSLALTYLTTIPIYSLYILCYAVDAIKCFIAVALVRRGKWAKQLSVKK